MAELTRERRMEILNILGSTVCGACGKRKQSKMSHCRTCYYKLLPNMRSALYQRFGDGYEEAYEDSIRYLQENKK